MESVKQAVNVFDFDSAFEKSFVGTPGNAIALVFGEYFIKSAFNSFGFSAGAENFLDALQFCLVHK